MNATLSVWSAYYIDLEPEAAVLEFKKHGYFCTELSDEHGLMLLRRGEPEVVGAQFRAFLEKEGFSMPQGHLWLSCKICTDEGAVETLLKWLKLYEAIGAKNAVLHCDDLANEPQLTGQERLERNLAQLLKLQAGMQGMSIRVCLENLTRICASVDELIYLTDRLDPKHFGICLDTGHLNMCGKDQADFIRKAGKRLYALHIADNEGVTDQHMMPYGKGNVDFGAVVCALREVDYDGLFNLEIGGERHAPYEILGYKLEYIRKCYDYLMKNS